MSAVTPPAQALLIQSLRCPCASCMEASSLERPKASVQGECSSPLCWFLPTLLGRPLASTESHKGCLDPEKPVRTYRWEKTKPHMISKGGRYFWMAKVRVGKRRSFPGPQIEPEKILALEGERTSSRLDPVR